VIRKPVLSLLCASVLLVVPTEAQTGAGNAAAAAIALNSAMVQSSYTFLQRQVNLIQDNYVRFMTADALENPATCVFSRAHLTAEREAAIVQTLASQGLIDPREGDDMAGVFPPLVNDGDACPQLPMPIYAAPGSAFGGHHSFPGGLMVHETFNSVSAMNFADAYRRVYGDVFIDQDLIVAAPLWHDWAKPIVFQWNADGTEFTEFNFGGNGTTDAYGKAGDSRTGAHHIIAIAEMMARGMPAELIVTTACAHSTPTGGAEYKVVNWIRAGAILAQVDPVARGYLLRDTAGQLRLPPFRALGSMDMLQGSSLSHTNTLAEYAIHNLSDSDFTFTGEAIVEAQSVLAAVAPRFGFSSTDTANYNNKFRNPVLSNIPAERLLMLYGNGGTGAVVNAIDAIKSKPGSLL